MKFKYNDNVNIYIEQIIVICSGIALIFIFGNRFEKIFHRIFQFLYDRITTRGLAYGLIVDDQGYPLYNYGRRNNVNIGYQYNPIVLCWLADKLYDEKKCSNDNIKKILNYADMAAGRHIKNSHFSAELHFVWPPYRIKGIWRSALVYGRLMQLFVRAYKLSNNVVYIKYAETVMHAFNREIKDGGVRIIIDENNWWYEEYASEDIEPPYILNGMISAVLCINEFYEISNNENAKKLVEKGINAIKSNINEFDREGFSYYDRIGNICSPYYHNFHIELLKRLMEKFPHKEFIEMRKKWIKKNEMNFIIKSIKYPTKRSVAVLLFSMFLSISLCELIYILLKIL